VVAAGGVVAEQGDGFGADERIEAVERFVEDEDGGVVRMPFE
jgi:hypothetical protein